MNIKILGLGCLLGILGTQLSITAMQRDFFEEASDLYLYYDEGKELDALSLRILGIASCNECGELLNVAELYKHKETNIYLIICYCNSGQRVIYQVKPNLPGISLYCSKIPAEKWTQAGLSKAIAESQEIATYRLRYAPEGNIEMTINYATSK